MITEFYIGSIQAILPNNTNSNGDPEPAVAVMGEDDGSLITIPMACPASRQDQFVVGYKVAYFQICGQQFRILQVYGDNSGCIRKGDTAQSEGDVVIQSETGLGYLRLGDDGNTHLVDGSMDSTIDSDPGGWTHTAPNIKFLNYAGVSVSIAETGEFSVVKTNHSTGETTVLLNAGKDDKMVVSAKAGIDLISTGGPITLDASEIYIGKGASDSTTQNTFGDLVTAGGTGTYPFSLTTGSPVEGSQTVKVAS